MQDFSIIIHINKPSLLQEATLSVECLPGIFPPPFFYAPRILVPIFQWKHPPLFLLHSSNQKSWPRNSFNFVICFSVAEKKPTNSLLPFRCLWNLFNSVVNDSKIFVNNFFFLLFFSPPKNCQFLFYHIFLSDFLNMKRERHCSHLLCLCKYYAISNKCILSKKKKTIV